MKVQTHGISYLKHKECTSHQPNQIKKASKKESKIKLCQETSISSTSFQADVISPAAKWPFRRVVYLRMNSLGRFWTIKYNPWSSMMPRLIISCFASVSTLSRNWLPTSSAQLTFPEGTYEANPASTSPLRQFTSSQLITPLIKGESEDRRLGDFHHCPGPPNKSTIWH